MPNTLIRASAGAGKTFQLSNRYLDIVFDDDPVETILAATFTRKAAGEILDRILQRFAEAALEPKKRTELRRFIDLPPRIREVSHRENAVAEEPDDNRQAAALQRRLAEIARNLYRLRIGTLDSFFNKIATSFSLELGLPPGWTIMEDTEYARCLAAAIRQVLRESQRNDARNLMNLLQQGEQGRNVSHGLFQLAEDLLPLARETDADAWQNEALMRTLLDEKELEALFRRLAVAPVPKNEKGKENGHFLNARKALLDNVTQGHWDKLLTSGLAKTVLTAKDETELIYQRLPLEGELLEVSRQLGEHARGIRLNKLAGQTQATRRLLDLILAAYDDILLRQRGYRFGDISNRLGHRAGDLDLASLAHRMDAETRHLLLDEFQDTSLLQWDVMKRFASEAATAPGGSFFCVGDVKQAIYAWRGGVAGIFETVCSQIPGIEEIRLNSSYRCSPVVIAGVNLVFEHLAENAALTEHGEAVKVWHRRFESHHAEKAALPGYVVLETCDMPKLPEGEGLPPNDDAENDGDDETAAAPDDPMLLHTIRRIRELHENHPGKTIGVLVARNKKIGPIIAGLRQEGIEASEEGGNPLTDSAAVEQVLSALTLADHPGDRVARFHLGHGPLAERLGLTEYRRGNCGNSIPAVDASSLLRREMLDLGFVAVVESLVAALAPACNPREFERLEKLLELARRYEETASGVRTRPFVDLVRRTRVESPSAAKIRIMTIHKSKGLEFDIVVLPDLENPLVKKTPKVIVSRSSQAGPVDFVVRYVDADIQKLLPREYRDAFARRIQGEVEEALSLLYVAMTRAIHSLVMIVKPDGDPDAASFAGILRSGFKPEKTPKSASILFEEGDENWFQTLSPVETQEKATEEKLAPVKLDCRLKSAQSETRRNLPRKTPSGMEGLLPAKERER